MYVFISVWVYSTNRSSACPSWTYRVALCRTAYRSLQQFTGWSLLCMLNELCSWNSPWSAFESFSISRVQYGLTSKMWDTLHSTYCNMLRQVKPTFQEVTHLNQSSNGWLQFHSCVQLRFNLLHSLFWPVVGPSEQLSITASLHQLTCRLKSPGCRSSFTYQKLSHTFEKKILLAPKLSNMLPRIKWLLSLFIYFKHMLSFAGKICSRMSYNNVIYFIDPQGKGKGKKNKKINSWAWVQSAATT